MASNSVLRFSFSEGNNIFMRRCLISVFYPAIKPAFRIKNGMYNIALSLLSKNVQITGAYRPGSNSFSSLKMGKKGLKLNQVKRRSQAK
jgi:hypothetical protein